MAAGSTLLLAALASSASAALAALGEHRAQGLLEEKDHKPPRGLKRLVERPDVVRLALLSIDSLAKLIYGGALALLAASLADDPPMAALAAAGGALVLLGFVTLCRALACRDPEASLSWAAPVGAAAEALLRPLVVPLAAISRRIRGPASHSIDDTTEQLEYLIEKGSEAGVLDDEKRDLLESVIEFSHVRVREIMVPRPKVVALPADAPYDEVVRVVVESGHSRVPVYADSVDNVVGVLYARRLLEGLGKAPTNGKGRFRIESHLTAPFFVPETMRISHLLSEFQRRGVQIAVVVDEFGGTAGVVTLEDVMEEIVGEIRDEDDGEEQQPIRALADGLFLAQGEVSVRDVEEFLEEALPGDGEFEFPEDGDYDTLGGFVTAMAGRVPRRGEQVRYGGLVFTVRAADEKRVLEVELLPESPQELPVAVQSADAAGKAASEPGEVSPAAVARRG
ncbi:hemolysin family protein [Vulgatibacter incomptus]|uniref:Magnesium and cobalt efflux protein CorC n=1 Tax=Vulgatibacter incomptus TaxID=1391653 RepID=A0A0K1PBU4_9BACT|nr:hemolysin family protein [Vulgatibacter incomptus]AKU91008.1 Magnesium and cobalt efflux protein CorC [Vulgatibacter incomptus]